MKPQSTTILASVFLAASLTSLLAACQSGAPKVEERTPEEMLELYATTATYLYEDGALTRAQDQAVKALAVDPKHQPMRRMVGWIRLRMGSVEDLLIADDIFRRLLRDMDRSVPVLLGLGTACERLGIAYREAGAAADPGAPPVPRSGELWREAVELFEENLVNREGSTQSMNGLQRVHALLGNYDESLTWTARVLDRCKSEVSEWRRLLTAEDLTKKEEALFLENEAGAVALQGETHLFAASLEEKLGRTEAALAHMNMVIELRPDLPQAYSRRAQLRERAGQHLDAIADIDRFMGMSKASFEDPEIQSAFDLRRRCEEAIREGRVQAAG